MRTTPVTDGQKRELERQLNDAIVESGLGKDGVQRALGKTSLKAGFVEHLRNLGNPKNPFASEVVDQSYFYPEGWNVPDLDIQAQRLVAGLNGFQPKWNEKHGLSVPITADGLVIVPTLSAIGVHWNITDPHRRAYGEVIEAVAGSLEVSTIRFTNCRKGELTEKFVQIPADVLEILEPLEVEAQRKGFTCHVFPFHFGDEKTGKCYSQQSAVWQAVNLPPARLPLEAAQIGCMFLTMPDRLTTSSQLDVDTASLYDWNASGQWTNSLYFYFNVGRLRLDARDADYAHGRYGLPVAFLGV